MLKVSNNMHLIRSYLIGQKATSMKISEDIANVSKFFSCVTVLEKD